MGLRVPQPKERREAAVAEERRRDGAAEVGAGFEGEAGTHDALDPGVAVGGDQPPPGVGAASAGGGRHRRPPPARLGGGRLVGSGGGGHARRRDNPRAKGRRHGRARHCNEG